MRNVLKNCRSLPKKPRAGFLRPDFSRRGLVRLFLIASIAALFFGLVCTPAFISGGSMLPTYPEYGFNFCWKPAFWFSSPRRGQVVIARYLGERVMLLKRVVALAGDTVEFRDGALLVNGVHVHEPYRKSACDWHLPPRTVEPGHVYLVGDNRSMPIDRHKFGQLSIKRVIGVPLW